VLREDKGDVRLTPRFRTALRYRDLLEIKLDYAAFAMEDFTNLFDPLVRSAGLFQERARIFDLFDYRRALSAEGENYLRTRQWMRIVSVLTRHEAVACLDRFDISGFRRMLDIGGNSGEFALRCCERNPGLRGTVFDLPLVCDVGLEHVLPTREAERISFIRGDARSDPFPEGADLITFKSMLHDWPGAEATRFLEKAARALAPGGSLMIFERGELRLNGVTPPWSMLPNLLFFRSYRPPETYMRAMLESGLQDVRRVDVELDSTFHIVTGRKPR
jgi:SAM-dependent methyltransferase